MADRPGVGHDGPFGDGGHPTTRLAAAALARELVTRPRGARVLDVGCGTGVLTRLAVSLGADVVAIDRAPEAAALTRARVPAAEVIDDDVVVLSERADRAFDIVVANLEERELVANAQLLKSVVDVGGVVIATGVLLCRLGAVGCSLQNSRPIPYMGYGALLWTRPETAAISE